MSTTLFPVALWERGYRDLVSVIPPNATLSPNSKITAGSLGKSPGRRNSAGLWSGYDWLRHEPSEDDVRRWAQDGANIGLLAERYPAVDIDCTDELLSREVRRVAVDVLGPAPTRIGRPPKALLMYRLAPDAEPFSRMALMLHRKDEKHLVEVLGAGRQYVIHGSHPSGRQYEWNEDITQRDPESLTVITRADVERFFARLEQLFAAADMLGVTTERLGDGRVSAERTTPEQSTLFAPSIEALEEAVSFLPNELHDRDHYLRVGYAIKAAGHADEDAAQQIFLRWCEKWTAKVPEPDVNAADWRRFHPPYVLGWRWLAEQARQYGYNDAANEFEPIPEGGEEHVEPEEDRGPPYLSDAWLAARVVSEHGERLRFVPGWGKWLVWDSTRWALDDLKAAERKILSTLVNVSVGILRHGVTDKEKAQAMTEARRISSTRTLNAVRQLVEANPAIAVAPESFDSELWLLNTPGGMVDLKSGALKRHDPGALCTKVTRTAPEVGGACPEWRRFLAETTGGDAEVEAYLQRIAGYCLTGSTREQVLFFVWGPGGNGKSVFLNTISALLGDYAETAPMDTFTSTSNDKHPTDLAGLMGARLVAASETQAGRRWDEARLKGLTGGDPVRARFMRQDFFTYVPHFKLLFVGNHKPEIRTIDKGMSRRIQIVPFIRTPTRVDPDLIGKLKEEWPAILGWMVEGCLQWQKSGLQPPLSIAEATNEYFRDEDALGRWIEERCERDPQAFSETHALFDSWREWANGSNEYVGSMKRFSQNLLARGFLRQRDPTNRRMGFIGIRTSTEKEEFAS